MQIWTVTELWKLHLKIKFGRRDSKSDYFCSSSRIVNLLRWPNKMHLKPLWRLYSTRCNELDGNYPKSFIHVLIPGTFACLFEKSFFFFSFPKWLRTLIREAHLELSRWTLKAITCPCKINTQRRRHPTKEEVVAMWLWGCRIVWCILTSRYLVSLLPVSIIHVSDIFLVGFWSWEISFIMLGCRGWGWQAAGTWVPVSHEMVGFPTPIGWPGASQSICTQ